MGNEIYESIKPNKKPINKDSLVIGIVILVILLLTFGIVAYYFWGVNNEIVVTYKGGEITRGEYEAVYRYWAPQLAYYGYDPASLSDLIVDEILLNEVMYKVATEKGFTLSEDDKTETDKSFADEDSVSGLRASGINPDILKKFFYENAVVSDYLEDMKEKTTTDELKASILASEGENADLNIYKTRHILFAFTSDMTDKEKAELLKEAKDVLAKVKKGEDFAELAKEYSDDQGTASDGGQFDMVNNQYVDEDYRKAAVSLKAGKVYNTVVESDLGYFIIKLESVEKNGRLTSEDDIDTYVNDYISKTIEDVFDVESEEKQKELQTAKGIANKINSELGLATVNSEE